MVNTTLSGKKNKILINFWKEKQKKLINATPWIRNQILIIFTEMEQRKAIETQFKALGKGSL